MISYTNKWLDHFRMHALAAADNVKEVTHVGAVLIGQNNEVLLTAYNGPAMGVRDTPERRSRTDGLKYKYSSHAERNLISFAARGGIRTHGLTVYATHPPCSGCANALVQAGIQCVIVGHGTYASSDGDIQHAETILHEAKVQVIKHDTSDDLDRMQALVRGLLYHKTDFHGDSLYYHCKRVMNILPANSPTWLKAAAWGHDLLEDTSLTHKGLLAAKFMHSTYEVISIVTLDDEEDYNDYIARICARAEQDFEGAGALIVKLADNYDNNDPARYLDLPEDKAVMLKKRYSGVREKLLTTAHYSRNMDKFLSAYNISRNNKVFSQIGI